MSQRRGGCASPSSTRSSGRSWRGWADRRSTLKPNGASADLSWVMCARVETDDRGDIVLGWLTKLIVVLGVLGLLGFDAISLVQSRFQASDRATTAASAAADSYKAT